MSSAISSLERFLYNRKKFLPKKARTGLVTNQVSYSFLYRKYLFEILEPDTVFLLEHGFFSELQDQVPLDEVSYYRRFSGITWKILYGNSFDSLKPRKQDLEGLDYLIIDIQDAGSRYYTFATSVFYIFRTILEEKLPVNIIVLDRNNPTVFDFRHRPCEGSPLQKKYESFVGIEGIPHKHGLTAGELLYYYWQELTKIHPGKNAFYIIPFLKDKPVRKLYPESEEISDEVPEKLQYPLPEFAINPSPNMPSKTTALVYTGQCLLEGTNLSEGRGTTKPFEIFGAPFLEDSLLDKVSDMQIFSKFGAVLRKTKFIPKFHKYKDQVCNGWQIHILNPEKYHSLLVSLLLLKIIKESADGFAWYRGVYEFLSEYLAIQYLLGDDRLFSYLEGGSVTFDEVAEYLRIQEKQWKKKIKRFLIY